MSATGVMPMPALARTALPPEPWWAAVRCAGDRVGFHPCLRACRCAESSVASVSNLVYWATTMSADDLSSIACVSECQELPLHVSMAQRPLEIHHLLVLTMVPSGSTSMGLSWLEAALRLLFLRVPSGQRLLLQGALGGNRVQGGVG